MIGKGSQKRVLVLEKDVVVRESIKKLLEMVGYEVVLAIEHEAEVEYVPDDIDLLLLDLDWPAPSSPSLLERLKMLYPFASVIILTGLPDLYRGERAASGTRVLEKPVGAQTLLKTVEELLAEPRSAQPCRNGGNQNAAVPSGLGNGADGDRRLKHAARLCQRLEWRPTRTLGGRR